MRNLADYELQYRDQPYERFQVRFRKRKVIELMSKINHRNILEIGCGLEPFFLDYSNFENLTILEPADMFYMKAIDQLNTNQELKGKVEIKQLMLEEYQPASIEKPFDLILLSSLLHEIPESLGFLKHIHSLCSPNTILHINVPNGESFHRLLAVEMGIISSPFTPSSSNIQFQQHSIFSLRSLKELCDLAGFKVLEEGSYAFKPFTHNQMEKLIQEGLLTNEMLEGFYKMEKYLPGLGSEIYLQLSI
jgi:hypothetical protein